MNDELPRRGFLLAATATAGLATFSSAPTAASAADENVPNTVVTVLGAMRGVPYALATSALDEIEFARRARINTVAFRKAWKEALATVRFVSPPEVSEASNYETVSQPLSGATIRVPPGFYPIDTWDMSVTPADLNLPGSEAHGPQYGEWSIRVTVEADGAVLVTKDYPGSPSPTTPVIYLGSPDSPGRSLDLLKRVTIRGLSIQSDTNPIQSFTATDRVGMIVHQAQEVCLEKVSIFGFRREGLRLEGVMDSTFTSVNIGWCGRSDAAEGGAFALAVMTTTDAAGVPVENCNALRFIGCHIEFCDLELLIDRGSRHVDFWGSKFEHGWATTSTRSPIQIGAMPGSSSPTTYVREISFVSCMFVQNTYAFEGSHPSHISVEEVGYVGSQSEKAKTAISFVACHFTVPDGGGERWFLGADTTFSACDFHGCGNAAGELACFDLGNDVVFSASRFSVVRFIHDGLTGDAGAGGPGAPLNHSRADLFRFHGGASRVLQPVIYFPARAEGVDAAPGSLVTIASGAGNGNLIAGWQTHWYGLPTHPDGSPGHIDPVLYEQRSQRHLLSRLTVDPWSREVTGVLPPDREGFISVMGRETLKLQGGASYNDFRDGYSGQVVRVVSDGGTAVLKPGSFVFRTPGSNSIGPGTLRTFVLYSDGGGAAWFEV
ncbi:MULTISPECIES: hypothetical protein [Microbacterium]|uniref:hypothetical protein n=1 Tax=Microbacterium TaxID=33882 RepID=UPI00278B6D09|nr:MULTISPECIES: hypothetical protein [Microbacterium]MDQ1076920.1 hypothetical protein [Microbacterium sp. SORGH_AS_0969]MDQ1117157.1 hypothetical protein [Microbacterium testaceum]